MAKVVKKLEEAVARTISEAATTKKPFVFDPAAHFVDSFPGLSSQRFSIVSHAVELTIKIGNFHAIFDAILLITMCVLFLQFCSSPIYT